MRIPALLILSTLCLNGLAQPKTKRAQVEWGPELNERQTGEFYRVFGSEGDAVYMTLGMKKDLFVQKMNSDLVSLYSKVLEMELVKKDLELEDLIVLEGNILVFASAYDKKADEHTLYVRRFDEGTMNTEGEWQSLASFLAEDDDEGSFGVELSPNGKHVLLHIQLPYEKDAAEKFRLRMYSQALAVEWEREITLPYSDKEFSFEDFRVDNDGDVIMIGVKYAEKREAKALKRAGLVHYDYHLLTYTADGKDHDHTIEVEGKFLQDLTLSLDTGKADILCAGLFGTKGNSQVRGSFFLRLDPDTKAVLHQSFKEFSDDFITQYMTPKEEKKARKQADRKEEDLQLYEYDLSDIVRRDDGGAVLVGEQYYTYVTTSYYTDARGMRYSTTTYHYVYNDIIVVSIDPDGNIAWASTIPKRQHSANDGGYYSSFALDVKGSNLYFVYNDNGENLFLAAGDKFKNTDFQGKSSIVTLATVNIDGSVTREALFDPEKRDLILRPKSCRQMEDDRMFMYATRGKEYRFGMVTFE